MGLITKYRSRPRERLHVRSLNEPASRGLGTPAWEQAWLRAGLGLALQIPFVQLQQA